MIERSQKNKIRILVAENTELIRIGLRALFRDHASIHLVAETDDIEDLFKLTAKHKPDVALIDLELRDCYGAEHIAKITHMHPQTKVLAFSDDINEQINLLAFHSGAAGIISKHQSFQSLLNAIHAIYAGETWFDRDTTEPMQLAHPDLDTTAEIQTDDNPQNQTKLSTCERRIAFLASQGLSAKEISLRLNITEKTVRNQLSVIYRKIGAKKQIELCLKAPQYNYFK